MERQRTAVALEEVIGEGLRANIKACDIGIRTFVKFVNKYLPDDMQLDSSKLYFQIFRSNTTSYENDGNTSCDGYKFEVFWAYDLSGGTLTDSSLYYFLNRGVPNCFYFTFEQSVRLHDERTDRSRFFSMYVTDMLLTRNGTVGTNKNSRIDYNNDNYKLLSILTPESAAFCVQEIKKSVEFYRLVNSLREECIDSALTLELLDAGLK